MLADKKVDVSSSGLSVRIERQQVIDFSMPVAEYTETLIAPKHIVRL